MWLRILVVCVVALFTGKAAGDYVGAVAEHTVFVGTASDSAEYLLSKNLEIYDGLTSLAAAKGVQVLVFPEFGLTPYPADKRSALYPFAEVIPSASERVIPCNNSAFSDRPVLSTMSCAALKNKINVLVNTVDYVACDATVDANCPADDHYQYNTDIVFDEQGMLVAKYHKSHEWPGLRDAYDQPTSTSQVTFKSSFGVEFGLFICFDIMFEDPPVLLRNQGIQHFLYAVQQGKAGEAAIIEPWSKRYNAVVLSANLGSGRSDCSGIIVNGNPLPAQKYYLDTNVTEFADENILVAVVPTTI